MSAYWGEYEMPPSMYGTCINEYWPGEIVESGTAPQRISLP